MFPALSKCHESAPSVAHSSQSYSHGGVIFCFPFFNTWKSSVMVTPPLLIPTVLFLSHPALKFSST